MSSTCSHYNRSLQSKAIHEAMGSQGHGERASFVVGHDEWKGRKYIAMGRDHFEGMVATDDEQGMNANCSGKGKRHIDVKDHFDNMGTARLTGNDHGHARA